MLSLNYNVPGTTNIHAKTFYYFSYYIIIIYVGLQLCLGWSGRALVGCDHLIIIGNWIIG